MTGPDHGHPRRAFALREPDARLDRADVKGRADNGQRLNPSSLIGATDAEETQPPSWILLREPRVHLAL